MGFLRVLLIILLVYYGLKILGRIFAPYLAKYVTKKAQERFGDNFRGFEYQQPQPPKKEGEVSIDKMPKQNTAPNKKVGEYVDYEEID